MSPTVTRAWHAALALLAGVALVGQTVLVVRADASVVDLLSYFTIQSNVLVLVTSVGLALDPARDGRLWRAVRLAALVGITTTGLVYAVAIGPYVSFTGAAWWYDKVFHYVVPLAAVVGPVLARPRTRFVRGDRVVLAWPVLWLAYTLVRGRVGSPSFAAGEGTTSRYPYDFIDVDAHGGAYVAVASVVVTLVLVGLALGYVRLGRTGAPAA